MKSSLYLILLLAAAFCFIGVQSQCKGYVADQFSAVYFRIMRVGEDNYEQVDEGEMVYDGIGRRYVFTPTPSSVFPRRIKKEFICNDGSGGVESITVLLNDKCERKPGRYFALDIPSVDDYQMELIVGGPQEKLTESLYGGRDTRERNEFLLTTSKCGPSQVALSLADRNFHIRWQLYNLNTSLPLDAFRIQCGGEPFYECGASYF